MEREEGEEMQNVNKFGKRGRESGKKKRYVKRGYWRMTDMKKLKTKKINIKKVS